MNIRHTHTLVTALLVVVWMAGNTACLVPPGIRQPTTLMWDLPRREEPLPIISFDADGWELPQADGTLLSDSIARDISGMQEKSLIVTIAASGQEHFFELAATQYEEIGHKLYRIADKSDRPASRSERRHIVLILHWPGNKNRYEYFNDWYDRALLAGRIGGAEVIRKLQNAVPSGIEYRFNLFGHGLGAVAIASALLGRPGHPPLVQPVHSLILIEAALPTYSFSSRIPAPRRKLPTMVELDIGPGYFWHIIRDKMVTGVILNIYSGRDEVLKRWYEVGFANRGAQPRRFRDPGPWGNGPNSTGETSPAQAAGSAGLRGPMPNRIDVSYLEEADRQPFLSGFAYNYDATELLLNHSRFLPPAVEALIVEAFEVQRLPFKE